MLTEVTLKVPQEVVPELKMLAEKLAGMEMANNHAGLLSYEEEDECVKEAINWLIQNLIIRRPRDYGLIMLAIDQGAIQGINGFNSGQGFIDYLKVLGFNTAVSRTTLFNMVKITVGDYPNWDFMDDPGQVETIRRRNVPRLFVSAYLRTKRMRENMKLNGNLNKVV